MGSSPVCKCLLAVVALSSFLEAPEASAGRLFGGLRQRRSACVPCCKVPACEPYGSCICVRYMMLNLGNGTEIYYALEHDACGTALNCQYSDEIWYSGSSLEINENCLTSGDCDAGGSQRYGRQCESEPALDRKKDPRYDLYNDPDPIALPSGTDVVITPIEVKEGKFRVDGGAERFAKVFIMSFKKTGHEEEKFAIGIETTGLEDPSTPDFTERAHSYRQYNHLYLIKLDPDQRDCVIITEPIPEP